MWKTVSLGFSIRRTLCWKCLLGATVVWLVPLRLLGRCFGRWVSFFRGSCRSRGRRVFEKMEALIKGQLLSSLVNLHNPLLFLRQRRHWDFGASDALDAARTTSNLAFFESKIQVTTLICQILKIRASIDDWEITGKMIYWHWHILHILHTGGGGDSNGCGIQGTRYSPASSYPGRIEICLRTKQDKCTGESVRE
jgi:hypothetical protein